MSDTKDIAIIALAGYIALKGAGGFLGNMLGGSGGLNMPQMPALFNFGIPQERYRREKKADVVSQTALTRNIIDTSLQLADTRRAIKTGYKSAFMSSGEGVKEYVQRNWNTNRELMKIMGFTAETKGERVSYDPQTGRVLRREVYTLGGGQNSRQTGGGGGAGAGGGGAPSTFEQGFFRSVGRAPKSSEIAMAKSRGQY